MQDGLSAQDIRDLLTELAGELDARGTQADLFLVGGAAMALAYDSRRSTRDVDAVFAPKQIVYEAARTVAARHDIHASWLNDAVKGYLHGPDSQSRPVLETSGLRVDVASPRYLLAMKLLSARAADAEDIRTLYRACGFSTAEQGLQVVEDAYPHRSIPAKVKFMVEEMFPPAAPE